MGKLISLGLSIVGFWTVTDIIKDKVNEYIDNRIKEGVSAKINEEYNKGYEDGLKGRTN